MTTIPQQPTPEHAKAMTTEARRLYDADEDGAALALAGLAVEAALACARPDLEFSARLVLCNAAMAMRNGELAATEVSRLLTLAKASGDPDEVAAAHLVSANLSEKIGDNEQALRALQQAWPLIRAGGKLREIYRAQHLFADAYGNLGDHEQAIDWRALALQTALATSDPHLQFRSLQALGGAWLDHGDQLQGQGQSQPALQAWEQSIAFERRALEGRMHGRPNDVIAGTINLGAALGRAGQLTDALALLDSAAEMVAASDGATRAVSGLALERARVLGLLDRADEALHELDKGIESAERTGFVHGLGDLYGARSSLAERHCVWVQALQDLKRSYAVRERIRSDRAELRARVVAVQLGLEQALAVAEAERSAHQALAKSHHALEERARNLQELAQVDALTGLANRRRLDAHLAIRHADCRARGVPLCVAMLDIDHFKQVNDHYSHSIGDKVLRELALVLTEVCRSSDLAARYGGEEFVVVFSDIGLKVAAAACERLRCTVQDRDWSQLVPGLELTISIGLTDIAGDDEPEQGLCRADTMLYRAKAGGRNRVVFQA